MKGTKAPTKWAWLLETVDEVKREVAALQRSAHSHNDQIGQLQELHRELQEKIRKLEGRAAP